MATTAALPDQHDGHGHDHDHHHPPFLAHHFDTPEQQFDSGKLGMWLFLVTEILFFSGLFCAYAIFRALRPEVFEGCSQFLNTKLGAINTGVLLFSSLSMAWAVRAAQTEQHKLCTGMIAATLSCAMIFLGVKTIEYSHKWDLGLLPPAFYFYNPDNPHHEGISKWLVMLCIPFAVGLLGLVLWLIKSIITRNTFAIDVAKPLIVVFVFFFVGVGLGMILESGESKHPDHAAHASHLQPGEGQAVSLTEAQHETEQLNAHAGEMKSAVDAPVLERLAADQANSGIREGLEARARQLEVAGSTIVSSKQTVAEPITEVSGNTNTRSQAGVFFAIYYCMTGVHAIHILAGIGVLIWLLVRSVRQDFNRQYFGPVDYVGLYWHIVDLIWIYLFPLLYLIR